MTNQHLFPSNLVIAMIRKRKRQRQKKWQNLGKWRLRIMGAGDGNRRDLKTILWPKQDHELSRIRVNDLLIMSVDGYIHGINCFLSQYE